MISFDTTILQVSFLNTIFALIIFIPKFYSDIIDDRLGDKISLYFAIILLVLY